MTRTANASRASRYSIATMMPVIVSVPQTRSSMNHGMSDDTLVQSLVSRVTSQPTGRTSKYENDSSWRRANALVRMS